jgi:diaminohydroxyphosphoribosylaminopyrimidine deaminase / 5-amino-6-(5-phosphoribosylamino)uracil reductase
MTEGEAMTRALDLAWRGWGRVHPNPMVGAVVLREGRVVAEGWHAEFGHPHAEAAALAAAGASARGATLVVTLEPCAHVGKQPPCVEAILGAGVARVVVGAADPNPAAAGGAARLAEAGVDVALQAHPGPVRDQNPAFFHAHAGSGRPFVALKLAISMDGMIADPAGRARWVSGEEARSQCT